MVDINRSSSAGFGSHSDNDSNAEKYAKIWFTHLTKFHKVPPSNSWNYEKDHVVDFLRDRKDSGVSTWKRLKIVQGLIWNRVHIQNRSPDFLSEMEKTLRSFVIKEKIEAMPSQEEIEGLVGKVNPNEPDVFQQLRRSLRSQGKSYNTEIAYVKKVLVFMADRNVKTLADRDRKHLRSASDKEHAHKEIFDHECLE
jgi:hypothetical protein